MAAVPTNFTASSGNASATLSWTASSGATSYNVKRSVQSGGSYTKLASPTSANYVDSTVTNGTTYYYVVSAVNSAGESANSAQVTAAPVAPSSSSTTSPTGAPVPGYVLKFADEFNSFSGDANGTNGWMTTYRWGGRTNNQPLEAEYYADSSVGVNPFSVTNGVLQISATAVSSTGANALGLPYNSGIITSYHSFSMEYGYFEMRAQLPAGAGLWPAFWLLPEAGGWPPEIDVMEQIGDPNTIYQTIHYTDSGGNESASTPVPVVNTSTGFHTYGVDWEPDYITVYFDGVQTAKWPTPSDMHQAMYIVANLAVGAAGSWPGMPSSASEFPANMLIDYIRAYASPNSTGISGSQVQQ